MKNKSIASLSLRKLLLTALVAAPLATLPVPLWAISDPTGSVTVTSGTATIALTNSSQVDINATSTNTVLKWSHFGDSTLAIGSGDVINFTLPSTSASVLNIVTQGTSSTIDGKLWSNGNLYILNPAGIVVSANGVLIANSVALSTVSETEYSFITTGQLGFTNNQPPTPVAGNIQNLGKITAASGTGNVWIVGHNIDLGGTIDAGNVTVSTQNNGTVLLGNGTLTVGDVATKAANLVVSTGGTGTITLGASNVVVYGPSVSLTTGNQTITQTAGGSLQVGAAGVTSATLTVSSGTADTTIGNASINASSGTLNTIVTAGNASIGSGVNNIAVAATTGGALSLAGAGDVTLNGSSVTGNVTVTAAKSILSGGVVTSGGAISLTAGNASNITFSGNATSVAVAASAGSLNNVSLTSSKALTLGTMNVGGNLTATAAGDLTQAATTTQTAAGTVTLNSTGGNVTLSQGITAGNLAVTAATDVTQGAAVALSVAGNGTASFTATGGNVSLDAIAITGTSAVNATAGKDITLGGIINLSTTGSESFNAGGNLVIKAALTGKNVSLTGAKVDQTAAGTITSSGTTTVTGGTLVTLGNATNALTKLVLKGGATDSTVKSGDVVLAGGTSVTGNVTLTAGNITVGSASADTIAVGGFLTLDNSAAAGMVVAQNSDNTTVTGNLNVKTQGGSVVLAGSKGTGAGLNNTYGQVNIDTTNTAAGANATVFSASDLNLGNLTLGTGALRAYSATNVLDSGKLSIGGNITVGAGTAAAPGNISLANSTASTTGNNTITGTVKIMDELNLLNASSAIVGTYLAKSITILNSASAATLIDLPKNGFGADTSMAVNLTTIGANDLNVGNLHTSGAVALTADTGKIVATAADNSFTTVTVVANSTTAGSAITANGALTVNATLKTTQPITFTAGAGGSGDLTIANFTSKQTSTTNGSTNFVDNNGAITDGGTGIFIYGDVSFTGKAVSITNAGHNFGGITVNTSTSNGNATIVEGGTSRYVSINTGTGMFSGTSQNGDILESAGTIAAKNVILSALNGGVTATGAANAFTSIGLTAKGNSSIANTAATTLGTISVTSGTLAVSTTGTAITQATGSTINAYGATSVTAGGAAGDITLGNSGNQFGALTLGQTGATGKITIKESGTMNLASVITSGAFTATSETSDIVDSAALAATGTTSLTANNVVFTKASQWGTIGVTTTGNASIVGSTASAVNLGASTVGGNLTVSSGTGKDITQSGALKVTGDATFTSGNGITLADTTNTFGTVKFSASKPVVIDSANTFTLRAGSFATDVVTINTGGDFRTTGTGGSSFTGAGASLTINALVGTIKPSAGSLLITGTFTVNSNVAVDLSALSQSGNLNNNSPVHPGTGTYAGPSL